MKNKVYKSLQILILLVLVVSFSFSTVSAADVEEIAISYVKLPLNVPSIIEKEKQLFEKEFNPNGIKVIFPEITQGSKMTQAVAAGSLDFCNALGGTSLILAAANGVDIKMIGVYSRAPKAFTIMAKDPAIKTTADLKGKKVVGPKGTILHQLLLASLNKNNLAAADVEFVNLGIARGISALLSESADAALVAGPAVPQALNNGAHIIESGEGLLDATIVIGVSGKFLEKNPQLVARYLKVHQQSLNFMEKNPEETYRLAAKETGISEADVKKMYGWYDFSSEIRKSDIKELKKTQEFLLENDLLSNSVQIESLIVD